MMCYTIIFTWGLGNIDSHYRIVCVAPEIWDRFDKCCVCEAHLKLTFTVVYNDHIKFD